MELQLVVVSISFTHTTNNGEFILMKTLYELQNEYEKLDAELLKIGNKECDIIRKYTERLISATLTTNLLSRANWTVGNCGYITQRLNSVGDLPIDFNPFSFMSGRTITLLPGVSLNVYSNLELIFENADVMLRFINIHNLHVDSSLEKQIKINKLEKELFELKNDKS